jgi:hypothetical protein
MNPIKCGLGSDRALGAARDSSAVQHESRGPELKIVMANLGWRPTKERSLEGFACFPPIQWHLLFDLLRSVCVRNLLRREPYIPVIRLNIPN